MDPCVTPTNRPTVPNTNAPRKRARSDTVESMNTDNSQLTTPTNRPTVPNTNAPERKAYKAVRSCPKFDTDDGV